jgi:hypothetical protein
VPKPVLNTPHLCSHHWRIEAPHGSERVRARCRRCKMQREYLAAWPEDVSLSGSTEARAFRARKRAERTADMNADHRNGEVEAVI